MHDWHADGSFEASFDVGATGGSLARRRRDDSWWNLGWSDVNARWSDDTWDWALSLDNVFDDASPAAEDLPAIRAWLDHGAPGPSHP